MKMNCWLILGTMVATTAVAQVNTTNTLPAIPPPATTTPAVATPTPAPTAETTQTNAPVKKAHKARKKVAKKETPAKKEAPAEKKEKVPEVLVTLVPGPATVTGEHINLRGQAGLQGEVVGHVEKGDTVTVIAQINLDKPKAGEPAQWAKIALPSGTKVWVDSKYVDATNNVVTAKKLNLRGGPGENYSVLGVVEKGAAVTVVTTKGDWTQIQTPASAFAFVAAGYLKQEVPLTETNVPTQPTVATVENPQPQPQPAPVPPPTPTTVPAEQTIAPPAATPPPTPETAQTPPPVTPPVAVENAQPAAPVATVPQPELAPEDTNNLPPPPPRIVSHEGVVRHSISPVAPTYFELFDAENDKAINYLYSPTTNLNLSRYDGLIITATGEEAMDARWKDTPVLTIEKINVLGVPQQNQLHPRHTGK